MEPWQEEELRQMRQDRRPLPRCVCCAETVVTEKYLDLSAFGLKALACQRCVEGNMQWNMGE